MISVIEINFISNLCACSDEAVQCLIEYLKDWKSMIEEPVDKLQSPDNHVDVLILGGGLAGIGAAVALNKQEHIDNKRTYLILEAQNQAGGRIKTVELLNYLPNQHETKQNLEKNDSILIDAGAQWLHGKNNFLYDISERYQLLASEQSDEGLGSFLYENGKQVNPYLVKRVDFFIGKLLSECEEFINNKNHPKSIGQFLRERFQIFVDSLKNVDEKKCALDLFDWHQRFQIIDNSCSNLDQLSAKYWGNYSFNGESSQAHYNFKNGFGTVINSLLSELNNEKIHYNKQVIEIHITNNQTETNDNFKDEQKNSKHYY